MKSSSRLAIQYKSPYTEDWWTVQMIAPMVDDQGACREDEDSLMRRSKTVVATHKTHWPEAEWKVVLHKGLSSD